MRILIAHENKIFCKTLEKYLETKGYAVSGIVYDGKELMVKCLSLQPDLAIISINLPKFSPELTLNNIKMANGNFKSMLLISAHDENEYLHLFGYGIKGLINCRTAEIDKFEGAIEIIREGYLYINGKRTPHELKELNRKNPVVFEKKIIENLSSREKEIFAFIAKGHTCKEISKILTISCRTVETHRTNIIKKLGIKSSKKLAFYAMQLLENRLIVFMILIFIS